LHYLEDVFRGIADPMRRKILNIVAYKSLNVNSAAWKFSISRVAIYKHIKVLAECGLIVIRRQGRERYCEARLKKLLAVSTWVDQYRLQWERRFDSLEKYFWEPQS